LEVIGYKPVSVHPTSVPVECPEVMWIVPGIVSQLLLGIDE